MEALMVFFETRVYLQKRIALLFQYCFVRQLFVASEGYKYAERDNHELCDDVL